MTANAPLQGVTAAFSTEPVQPGPSSKRKRNDEHALGEDINRIAKRSRHDTTSGTASHPVLVESGLSDSDHPPTKTAKQPLMVALPSAQCSKRKRDRKNSFADSEEVIV